VRAIPTGFVFQSSVMFDDVLSEFDLSFFDIHTSEDEFSGETLSYFITSYLERFPRI